MCAKVINSNYNHYRYLNHTTLISEMIWTWKIPSDILTYLGKLLDTYMCMYDHTNRLFVLDILVT